MRSVGKSPIVINGEAASKALQDSHELYIGLILIIPLVELTGSNYSV